MPKGVTNVERVILSARELRLLRQANRVFNRPRVTSNNLDSFRLLHEDLRDVPLNEIVVLEVTSGSA